MTTRTDVSIVQAACVLVGIEPITTLTDNSTEAKVANANYIDLVENELSLHPWRFATKSVELNRLVNAPVDSWDAAYQIPSDIIDILTVNVNDQPIEYERYTDMIYCSATVDDTVVLHGSYHPDENFWPPYFVRLIEYRMASLLGAGVAHRADIAGHFANEADRQQMKARHRDSAQQSNERLKLTRYKTARHNS